ncbi:ATP-binding protein, partial [Hallella sp.]
REVFVPFFTTKRSGSGIGLSLARQMMMAQGGNLTLADTSQPGCHTTFVINVANKGYFGISN